ncbi:MAG: hypothetical protein A2798_04035 [Candidatus Levybacteria bacterium RIFCSPHIGHO2_01_FULL_37_17]|nr:MAG: hypothetical protein A2798_04035 [Candidatus Levybacteria bacterium RIFCSPHIGHO2_01_FULL_37_17]OGH36530.1 MAG: hypothetical protein A2959_03500 [Candidatus Levybacteria bacterium RIFCSPLOWO2_01_FULL_38_23]
MADKNNKKQAKIPAQGIHFSPKMIGLLAEEIAKTMSHIPTFRPRRPKEIKKIENAIFLDTSAIIDGRIFDVIHLGLLTGELVVLESILLELKHIADSKDLVKRERGRKGLALLEKVKRVRGIKFTVFSAEKEKSLGLDSLKEVDERLISAAKQNKGRLITCDYNLEKKASINGVVAINVNTLANLLKVIAVPGETLHIKIQHKGKDITQGVGYLDDGTMIVVEQAASDLGRELNVVVSRVIQTSAGRILFSKKL